MIDSLYNISVIIFGMEIFDTMKVLVVNAGSSSLKYQLFDTESLSVLAKGNCERIGIEGSRIIHKDSVSKS